MWRPEFFTVFDAAFDAIGLAAPDPWRWVYANGPLAELLGASLTDLCHKPLESAFDEDSRSVLMEEVNRVWNGAETSTIMVGLTTNADVRTPVEVRLCRMSAEEPLIGVIIRRAVDPTRAARFDSSRLDPLTNLPDRTFLLTRLASLMRSERSADSHFAVLFIDLDDFKRVNDRYGHLVGDNVLREAARRLSHCVREGDHVVRFGGDEFIVLVEQVAGWTEIDAIINRIRAAIARPITLPEGEVTLSLSVGVAEASPEHHSPEELLRAADRAMYAAKPVRS
jgi:diguanylate cyclase (GGDEF)-like protein